MKRIVPAVLVVALMLPAHAAASRRDYSGAVDAASGTIEFTLKKRKATKKRPKTTSVRRFSFDAVPVTCEGALGTTTGHLKFGMRVIDKRFGARGADDEGSNVRVKGTLKQKGKRVVGTLRLFGDVPLDPDARRGANCATGKLRWTAQRV
jgi:hypothetical protein